MRTDVVPGDRIDARIARTYAALTPQERRGADTLLEHLDDLATYRAAELAGLARVSKATMSRLFRKLGFTDFDEVRDQLRTQRVLGEPRRVEGAPNLDAHLGTEADALHAALRQPGLEAAAEAIADAGTVLVVGWRNSYPVALHLREQLIQARPSVDLAPLPGQMIGEELPDLGPTDVVIAVGIRRRPAGFGAFLDAAAATGAQVIVLADPGAVVHLGRADIGLACPVQTGLAFDSYASAMSLISVLADGVLSARGRAGRDRVDSISATYERLRELE